MNRISTLKDELIAYPITIFTLDALIVPVDAELCLSYKTPLSISSTYVNKHGKIQTFQKSDMYTA